MAIDTTKRDELQAKIEELSSKSYELRSLWKPKAAEVLGIDLTANKTSINSDMAYSYSKDYEADKFRTFDVSLPGVHITLSEDPTKIFYISTTGCSTRSYAEDVSEILEYAANVQKAIGWTYNSSAYDQIKACFDEAQTTPEVVQIEDDVDELLKLRNEENAKIDAATKLAIESERAAKRIVGQLMVQQHYNWREIGIVTRVTPKKVKIESYSVYPSSAEESIEDATKRMAGQLTEQLQRFIDNDFGSFVQNEALVNWTIYTI